MGTNLRIELINQLGWIKNDCAIDAYGDEGEGYDFSRFYDLLIEAGWQPPSEFTTIYPR